MSPEEWARRQAELIIKAQIDAIKEQQRIYLEELQRQAQMRSNQGKALAAWLQGRNFPGQVQGLHQTAGGDIAGYGKAFSGELRELADAGAAEQLRMLSGTGQEGAIANDGQAMGDVMYGQYGYVPAKGIAEAGAALASDAAMQPAFAVRAADEAAMQLQQEGMGELSQFAAMMAEAKGQRPTLVQDLLNQRREYQFEAQDRARDEQDRQRDWFLKMAAYYNAIGDDKRAANYLRLAQKREQRYSAKDQGMTPDGKLLPGYKWKNPKNHSQGTVKVQKKSGKKPTSRLATGKQDILEASSEIDSIIKNSAREVTDPNTLLKSEVFPSYEELYGLLTRRFSGLLAGYQGRVRRQLEEYLHQIIDDALYNAGIIRNAGNTDAGSFSGDR